MRVTAKFQSGHVTFSFSYINKKITADTICLLKVFNAKWNETKQEANLTLWKAKSDLETEKKNISNLLKRVEQAKNEQQEIFESAERWKKKSALLEYNLSNLSSLANICENRLNETKKNLSSEKILSDSRLRAWDVNFSSTIDYWKGRISKVLPDALRIISSLFKTSCSALCQIFFAAFGFKTDLFLPRLKRVISSVSALVFKR